MSYRCKLTAKQDLACGKIKKGDVITFVTPGNSGNPNYQTMCEAIANYIGEKKLGMCWNFCTISSVRNQVRAHVT